MRVTMVTKLEHIRGCLFIRSMSLVVIAIDSILQNKLYAQGHLNWQITYQIRFPRSLKSWNSNGSVFIPLR